MPLRYSKRSAARVSPSFFRYSVMSFLSTVTVVVSVIFVSFRYLKLSKLRPSRKRCHGRERHFVTLKLVCHLLHATQSWTHGTSIYIYKCARRKILRFIVFCNS